MIFKILIPLLGVFAGFFIRSWRSASRGAQSLGPAYLGEGIAAASVGFALAIGGWVVGLIVVVLGCGAIRSMNRLACSIWCKRHPEAKLLNPRRHAVLMPQLSFDKWQSEKDKAQAMARQMLASADRNGTRKLREFGDLSSEVNKMLNAVTNVCGPRAAQLIFDDNELLSFYLARLQYNCGDHAAAASQLAAGLGLSQQERRAA